MSTTTPNSTKAQTLADLQALVSGLQKQFPSGQFTLENATFSTQSLVTLIQGVITAIESLTAAEANAKAAVSTTRATVASAGPTISALKRNLLSMFGNAPQTLMLFGLQPAKAKAPRSSEQKAVAAAKARATRIARGTTSKKQKAAIKGNVIGGSMTLVTAPTAAPASPSAQPASSASTASPSGSASK